MSVMRESDRCIWNRLVESIHDGDFGEMNWIFCSLRHIVCYFCVMHLDKCSLHMLFVVYCGVCLKFGWGGLLWVFSKLTLFHAQFPFLNYWGPYFLLFELSTPLLHVRKAMLLTGNKGHPWFPAIESAFAFSFFVARILVGVPMSALVWRDLLQLLNGDVRNIHSHFVVYFYLVANFALCSLNLVWFWNMIKKRFLGNKKKVNEVKTE